MHSGEHRGKETKAEAVAIADFRVAGATERAMMLPVRRAIAGDVGPDLPADEAIGDPVVGVPIGGKAEVRRFVDEQLKIGDSEPDQRCAGRDCERARHSHCGDDGSKGQIAQGDVPANNAVVRR